MTRSLRHQHDIHLTSPEVAPSVLGGMAEMGVRDAARALGLTEEQIAGRQYHRAPTQDAGITCEWGAAIGDGVGGARNGEVASLSTVTGFATFMEEVYDNGYLFDQSADGQPSRRVHLHEMTDEQVKHVLGSAVRAGTNTLNESLGRILRNVDDEQVRSREWNAQTTFTAFVYLGNGRGVVINTGDSPGWLIRAGSDEPAELISEIHADIDGSITGHEGGLLGALCAGGINGKSSIQFVEGLQSGDVVVLGSDGWSGKPTENGVRRGLDPGLIALAVRREVAQASGLTAAAANLIRLPENAGRYDLEYADSYVHPVDDRVLTLTVIQY